MRLFVCTLFFTLFAAACGGDTVRYVDDRVVASASSGSEEGVSAVDPSAAVPIVAEGEILLVDTALFAPDKRAGARTEYTAHITGNIALNDGTRVSHVQKVVVDSNYDDKLEIDMVTFKPSVYDVRVVATSCVTKRAPANGQPGWYADPAVDTYKDCIETDMHVSPHTVAKTSAAFVPAYGLIRVVVAKDRSVLAAAHLPAPPPPAVAVVPVEAATVACNDPTGCAMGTQQNDLVTAPAGTQSVTESAAPATKASEAPVQNDLLPYP